jgi:hypothetical protein
MQIARLTQINGLGPYLALKLIAECSDDLSAWPSAKHFTSWLCLAPSNKISGGKVLSSRTRRSGSRAAALLRLAAVTVGRTDTVLGAFYRRLSARKIAVLFYNAVRHGMEYVDPGGSFYGTRYRTRVINNLHRRAKAFGFVLQPMEVIPGPPFLRKRNISGARSQIKSFFKPPSCSIQAPRSAW